jgi:Na+/H+-dicarboxylate symporter
MGFALSAIGEKGRVMRNFFSEWAKVSLKMLSWIMELAPFGAGALIAYSVGVHGPEVLGPLGFFVVVVYIGEILILVEYTLLMLITGLKPVSFFQDYDKTHDGFIYHMQQHGYTSRKH